MLTDICEINTCSIYHLETYLRLTHLYREYFFYHRTEACRANGITYRCVTNVFSPLWGAARREKVFLYWDSWPDVTRILKITIYVPLNYPSTKNWILNIQSILKLDVISSWIESPKLTHVTKFNKDPSNKTNTLYSIPAVQVLSNSCGWACSASHATVHHVWGIHSLYRLSTLSLEIWHAWVSIPVDKHHLVTCYTTPSLPALVIVRNTARFRKCGLSILTIVA